MTHRSIHLSIYTFLVGLIILSASFNLLLLSRGIENELNPPVSTEELSQMMREIDSLSTIKKDYTKYNTKTKEPE